MNTRRALAAAVAAFTSAALAAAPAAADDLASKRTRAQSVADRVTGLEQRLERLRRRHEELQIQINQTSRDIAELDLEISDADAERRVAMDRYVERAVELYKIGSTTRLGLLLSARTLNDAFTIANAAMSAAEIDRGALDDLQHAKQRLETAQALADARKQSLLAKQREVEELAESIRATLAERRSALRELNARVAELEEEARAQAALQAVPLGSVFGGPSLDIPDGYASTGVSFEGVASWYGPGFEGNTTANGETFDSRLYTAASKELPFGTLLYVTFQGRGVVVRINDRGPYIEGRILDLSQAAAEAIGLTGIGWIRAEIILEE